MASKVSNRTNDDAVVFFARGPNFHFLTLSKHQRFHAISQFVGGRQVQATAYRFLFKLSMLYAIRRGAAHGERRANEYKET